MARGAENQLRLLVVPGVPTLRDESVGQGDGRERFSPRRSFLTVARWTALCARSPGYQRFACPPVMAERELQAVHAIRVRVCATREADHERAAIPEPHNRSWERLLALLVVPDQ